MVGFCHIVVHDDQAIIEKHLNDFTSYTQTILAIQ